MIKFMNIIGGYLSINLSQNYKNNSSVVLQEWESPGSKNQFQLTVGNMAQEATRPSRHADRVQPGVHRHNQGRELSGNRGSQSRRTFGQQMEEPLSAYVGLPHSCSVD